ncbi:MAG: hypothetical protein ACREEM_47455, partial [Blastocatellia bacterium]
FHAFETVFFSSKLHSNREFIENEQVGGSRVVRTVSPDSIAVAHSVAAIEGLNRARALWWGGKSKASNGNKGFAANACVVSGFSL